MIGYAVGEVIKPSDEIEESTVVGDSVDGEEESNRWHPQHNQATCYEIVTAWVHPRYISHMYIDMYMYMDFMFMLCPVIGD